MRVVQITLAAALGGLVLATGAGADTVASFADPATLPNPSLFQYNAQTGVLTGGWVGLPNLLLETPGTPAPDFSNAQFTMTPLATITNFGPVSQMTGGTINFYSQADVGLTSPLLTISFSSAYLTTSLGLGSSDFVGFNVVFSGPILNGVLPIANEAFSFSFANPVQSGGAGPFGPRSYTVSSSFTSSADLLVPAPGAAALLGMGGLFAARRRRR